MRKLVAVPRERFDEVAERVASCGDSEVFLCPDLVKCGAGGRRGVCGSCSGKPLLFLRSPRWLDRCSVVALPGAGRPGPGVFFWP